MKSPLPNSMLCLACSSSFPPKANGVFVTLCCNQPICSRCLRTNPRLARYNPCLACLGGVDAVGASSGVHLASSSTTDIKDKSLEHRNLNLDGAVRDEDVFVLGEEDEDDDGQGNTLLGAEASSPLERRLQTPPPAYDESTARISAEQTSTSQHTAATQSSNAFTSSNEISTNAIKAAGSLSSSQQKYYIQKGDTLLGISLKLGINARTLCRVNHLPPSTLSTTPHLLHTRTYLTIPAPCKQLLNNQCNEIGEEHERRRARERAEKRFQILTKEADWRVAKAYVSLSDDTETADDPALKLKELEIHGGHPRTSNTMEGRAIDQYLDDEEWEANESRQGRGVNIPSFPFAPFPPKAKEKAGIMGSLWRRRS